MTKILKKPIAFLTVLAMLLSVLLYFPAGTFGGFDFTLRADAETVLKPSENVQREQPTSGSGSSSDPYIIMTKENLYWFASKTNVHAKLGADIVVNSGVLDSNGNLNDGTFDEWPGLKLSKGSFDGGNHTIKGIIVKQPTSKYQGFITGSSMSNFFQGEVKNLKIADSYIEGDEDVGGICGFSWDGVVSNCSFDGTVIGNTNVAGICGRVQPSEHFNNIVEKCINTGKVSGAKRVGGIVGYADDLIKIEKCVNKGNISGTEHIGGIAGNSKQSLVKECWNEGEITGNNYVAGVVGYQNGTSPTLGTGIRNCYNIGKVSGVNYVAGIAANVEEIEYCFNIGAVTGTDHVYGVGTYSASKVSKCYYDNTICTRDDSNYHYAIGLDTSAFTSGEVAFLLRSNGENCWGQNLDDNSRPIDAYPVLTNGDPKLAVYYGQENGGNPKYHNHLSDTCRYCPFVPVNPALVEGKYVIDTPNKLYWFACFVNGTTVTDSKHPNASAVLADDFTVNLNVLASLSSPSNLSAWSPIGDDSNKFTGSFDGQGHTISGLYFNSDTAGYAGLFGAVGSTGSVSNVGIVDSYFKGTDYVGCISGANEGTISGCFSISSKVDATGPNKGGICGSGVANVENSCTNLSGLVDRPLYIANSAFSSGEVAYLLNGDQTKLVWGQNVDTTPKDTLPTVFTPEKRVYKGTVSPYYHNHASNITYCAVCPTYLPKEPDKSGEIYQISNVNELYWFAGLVNGTLEGVAANKGAKGVLIANIKVNEGVTNNVDWTPIGTETYPFIGSFDGMGYTISGLKADNSSADNVGLFGVIGGTGSVSNVGIVNSEFNGNNNVGAVAGINNGTISGCFSTSTVSGTTNVGGIYGSGSGLLYYSYYLGSGVTGAGESEFAKDNAAFASGEVAYLLNGNQTTLVWGQLLGATTSNDVPCRILSDNSNRVYKGRLTPFYHNHASDITYCAVCPTYIPKTPTKNGEVYEITDVYDLYWFAQFVNSGNTGAKAVLKKNIVVNQGVLNNNGSLSSTNFVYWTPIGTKNDPFAGRFDGNGFTISGLVIDNAQADYVGLFGVIGSTGSVSNVGVVDSYFNGKDCVGAIAGKNDGIISGCFSTSAVSGITNVGGISGNASEKVTNCYYLGAGVSNATDSGISKDSVAFASGEVAYHLNSDMGNRVWGQNIGVDRLPVPAKSTNAVYLGIDQQYHNHTENMLTCEHCSTIIPATPDKVDGVYRITNANELYGFVEIVNGGSGNSPEPGAKAILTKDITVNAGLIGSDGHLTRSDFTAYWVPVGNPSNPFTGSFDGNGHTVSGLYRNDADASHIGLIGYAGSGAVISKVCVSDSYFNAKEYIGAVCGYNNSGTISECCATGNAISGDYAGGISGYNSGTVKNCYNTSKVSGTKAAGIVSVNEGAGKIQCCINNGSIGGTDCVPVCAAANNVTKCYYNTDFSSCTGGAGTALSTWELTDDSFFAKCGFDTSIWEKKTSDKNYLYYPSLKNIKANDSAVGYTARFDIRNTTTLPVVYGDDMTFTFDAVLDIEGISNPVSMTGNINPSVLTQMDFKIIHNGTPMDTVISYSVDFASGKLILLMDGNTAGSISYDDVSKKIIVIITEDLYAGENTVKLTYNGTAVPLFTGVTGSCTVEIGKALPDNKLPDAAELRYGQPLSDSTLSVSGWNWADGTVIPTVNNTGYLAAISVDDENYDYSNVEGYNSASHTLKKTVPVTVSAAVPEIVVTADTTAKPGGQVTVSAVVSNPNNAALNDFPEVSELTYKIGNGTEQTITDGSFVIPTDAANNSIITISAKTAATDNYAAGSGAVTVTVKAETGGGNNGGGYFPSRPITPTTPNYPSIGGSTMSWNEISASLSKLAADSEITIDLNGNTNVPVEVIKAIDDRDLKVTFVVDSVRRWKTDGAEITAPAAADLAITVTTSTKPTGLRGIEGTQFRINNTGIPTSLEILFKSSHAGKFANLYKSENGKLTFVSCAKIGEDGKVILPEVAEKCDYIAMINEQSDMLGDITNDGVVNIFDAVAIADAGISGRKLDAKYCDFNGDGVVNILDAVAIAESRI